MAIVFSTSQYNKTVQRLVEQEVSEKTNSLQNIQMSQRMEGF